MDNNLGNIQTVDIDHEMRGAYLDYAMSVIVARALPSVRDGLKPVQRRILYGMHELGLRPNSPYRKGAKIVGEVMGSYHPHGDAALYDALARMAQDFTMRYPLVDGQGNFGSVDGDPPAAMRYTEARLTPLAMEMLADIEKNTVDFGPNYDGSLKEPLVLPSVVPNLLVNGASGIAVGMATNIPPHNLTEVCEAIIYLINNPECGPDELVKFIKGPDFPTGGIIQGTEGILSAYRTGRGRICVRARVQLEEERAGRFQIIVNELPYQVNKATLIAKIAELVQAKKITGISDLRDESDREGMRILIEVRRDAEPKVVLNQLFKYTQMQATFGANILALVDNEPRVLPLKRILQHYVTHRQEVVTRRTQFELEKALARAHILEGLKIALDNLDAVIRTIRESATAELAKSNLMTRFELSDLQAVAILDMQLRRLAQLERRKIEEEYAELLKTISYLEDLLANPKRILAVMQQELVDLKKKFGDARRTQIKADEATDFEVEDLVRREDVAITITTRDYAKRVPISTYRRQRRGGKGIMGMVTREEDAVRHLISCSTHDYVLFFTDRGRVFQTRAYDLPDASRQAKGTPLINLLALDRDERVTSVLAVSSFPEDKYLVMATHNGVIKKCDLGQFADVRRSGIIAINLKEGDELCWVVPTSGKDDLVLVTDRGKALRFNESEVRSMGRNAAGVIAMKLAEGDHIASLSAADVKSALLIITRNGYGKRTPIKAFNAHGRATQGVIAISTDENSGPVAGAVVVGEADKEVIVMSAGGLVIRTQIANISSQGRGARGVKVMDLKEGDSVVSLSPCSADEEPESREQD